MRSGNNNRRNLKLLKFKPFENNKSPDNDGLPAEFYKT